MSTPRVNENPLLWTDPQLETREDAKISPQTSPITKVSPMAIILFFGKYIWILGTIALFIYSLISYRRLKTNVSTATLLFKNVYETDEISSPFVCGLVSPKIYLPVGIDEEERAYVLQHERIHIERLDYLIKPLAFFVLSLHWFNPFMWLAFRLMSRDMEMSCDERVIKELDREGKAQYGKALVCLAMGQSTLAGNSLAFGESRTKGRIKNVLNYRKPMFWVTWIVVLGVLAVAISLVANPVTTFAFPSNSTILSIEMEAYKEGVSMGKIDMVENENLQALLTKLEKFKKIKAFINNPSPQGYYMTLRIELSGEEKSLYAYSEGEDYFIEEPYVGVYRGTKEFEDELYNIYIKNQGINGSDGELAVKDEDNEEKEPIKEELSMPGNLPIVYTRDKDRNEAFIKANLLPEIYWDTENKTDLPIEGDKVSIPSGRLVFAFLPTRPHEDKSINLDEKILKEIYETILSKSWCG